MHDTTTYRCMHGSTNAVVQFRWATVPIVKAAQLERIVDLPPELLEPWDHLQQYFGCDSESGNNTSNLVLNFDVDGQHVYKINSGLSQSILSSEEAFSRIFYEIEVLVRN